MRVLVTGASGLIGSALVPRLVAAEHEVTELTRSEPSRTGQFRWDPAAGELDAAALAGADAVIHLAGESVAGRWTAAKKRRILDSRVAGTRLVSEAIAAQAPQTRVLVCASAIGWYGNPGDASVNEQSPPGSDFLAGVVQQWEAAAEPARAAGTRVVHLRFGIVQSPAGGALRAQLPLFRLGLGGRVGSGRQYVSWVAIDDVVRAVEHALVAAELSGPANVTAPHAVTYSDYVRTLGRVLGRPAVLPAPAPAVRLVLGEFAGELLWSRRVVPERLLETGFEFRYPHLEEALRHVLGRPG